MLKIKINLHQVNNQFSLNKINLKIKSGTIFALIGKSGSGKSTIAKICSGELISKEASITLNELELNTNHERLIREFEQIGYVPQNLHLKPHHTILEFLEMLYQSKTKLESKKIIQTISKEFNLEPIILSKISSLSGGERQKLALIQAISKPIKSLVLDEPFSQLDTLQKQEISDIIEGIVKKLQIPCLMISHDIIDVVRLSNSLGVIHNGKVIFIGNWNKFYSNTNKKIIELRLGIDRYLKQTKEIIQFLNSFLEN
ncbi:MAG: hypothetical protein RJA76_19 [Bacteroidota bacterium]|jgi:iron(III) transport system ATP-binding protein